jgi:DNA-binding transcriptional ArsR family regulator
LRDESSDRNAALTAPRLVDRTMAALADPHRRRVVELLSSGPRSAGELAREIGLSPPAMSRHLRTLREARVVDEVSPPNDARKRIYRLRPQPMGHLKAWLEQTEQAWAAQLAAAPGGGPQTSATPPRP